MSVPRRGECYWANLNPTVGHEQAGLRPVLVVSDDRYNARSRMVLAMPLTSLDKLQPPLALDLGTVGGKQAFALSALSATRLVRLIEAGRVVDVGDHAVLGAIERNRDDLGTPHHEVATIR